MTDRPIIFSAPMVRALLAGAKTQTRRVLKPQPARDLGALGIEDRRGRRIFFANTESGFAKGLPQSAFRMPYAPGDRLWVREAWRAAAKFDRTAPRNIEPRALVSYDADFTQEPNDGCRGKARRSFHMPRWASRLTLDVTGVKVERLQEISEEDAEAEGAIRMVVDDEAKFYERDDGTFKCGFAGIWAHINGPDAWDANPWVVAIIFTVRHGNIDR